MSNVQVQRGLFSKGDDFKEVQLQSVLCHLRSTDPTALSVSYFRRWKVYNPTPFSTASTEA